MYTRLRALRKNLHMSQREIACMLNMSQTGYSKYELGEGNIPNDILIRLASFYHTSIDYILFRTDIIDPLPPSDTDQIHTALPQKRTRQCCKLQQA